MSEQSNFKSISSIMFMFMHTLHRLGYAYGQSRDTAIVTDRMHWFCFKNFLHQNKRKKQNLFWLFKWNKQTEFFATFCFQIFVSLQSKKRQTNYFTSVCFTLLSVFHFRAVCPGQYCMSIPCWLSMPLLQSHVDATRPCLLPVCLFPITTEGGQWK